MTSKDSNYISNKLSELKRTALQTNDDRVRMANPTVTTQYISKQGGVSTVNDTRQVTYSVNRQVLGGSEVENEITVTRVRKDYPTQPSSIGLEDYKSKLNQDISYGSGQKETYRITESPFRYETSPPKVTYKSYTNTPIANNYTTTLDEPRVVRARNVQTPVLNNNYDTSSTNYIGTNLNYIGTTAKPYQSYSVDKFKQTAPILTQDTSYLKNMTATALTDRYKVNMAEDLNVRLQECSDINRRLSSEVDQLKRAFEAEKMKNTEVDKMCREDLGEAKKREQETQKEWEEMERRRQDKLLMIKKHDDKAYTVN